MAEAKGGANHKEFCTNTVRTFRSLPYIEVTGKTRKGKNENYNVRHNFKNNNLEESKTLLSIVTAAMAMMRIMGIMMSFSLTTVVTMVAVAPMPMPLNYHRRLGWKA